METQHIEMSYGKNTSLMNNSQVLKTLLLGKKQKLMDGESFIAQKQMLNICTEKIIRQFQIDTGEKRKHSK